MNRGNTTHYKQYGDTEGEIHHLLNRMKMHHHTQNPPIKRMHKTLIEL